MTVAVDDEDDLRVVRVSPVHAAIPVGLPLREVAADMMRLHARTIDGRQANTIPPHSLLQRPIEDRVEHPTARDGGQEPRRGLLEGREVGHGPQVDEAAQVGMVREVRLQASVIECENSLSTRQARSWGWVNFLGLNLCAYAGTARQAAS